MDSIKIHNNRITIGVALVVYFEMLEQFKNKCNIPSDLPDNYCYLYTGNELLNSCSGLFTGLRAVNSKNYYNILLDLKVRIEIVQDYNFQEATKFFAEFVEIVESGLSVAQELETHLQNAREVSKQ